VRTIRWVGLSLAACLLACSPAPKPRETVDDLAVLFPVAEVHREVGDIDFGSFAGREHLTSGWYQNERDRTLGTFVWSKGDASDVEIFLAAPRDLRAEIRCAPVAVPGPPQTLRVEVNGRPLGTVVMSPGMRDYTIALPRALLVSGTNRLRFRYRNAIQDAKRRQLAVQWDRLRFRPLRPEGAAPPRSEQGAIYLPFGTEAVYFVDLPEAGDLSIRRIEKEAAGTGGRLIVSVQEENGRPDEKKIEAGSSARVELPGSGDHLVRIALRAVAAEPEAVGGLRVVAPRVLSVRPREKTASVPERSWPQRPNIILYLVDTLRTDRLGCYGAAKPTSPALDAFAGGATLFEHAVAQASWTRPSVTSVLTGLTPLRHGVRTLDDRLSEEASTLPEQLRAAGYRTAGFSTNPNVSQETGLAQGFDDFHLDGTGVGSATVNQWVLDWLDQHRGTAPFFLYIHTLDPHAPYEAPVEMIQRFAPGVWPGAGNREEIRRTLLARGEERARRIAQLSALYDAEVATNDRSFGELLAALRQRNLFDSSLVVFLADHGEEFDEHGFLGHGNNLYAQTLHVPLIVKWPHQTRGERVRRLAQHVDLLPTLLRAAGLTPPNGQPGTDLYALAALQEETAGRRAVSHLSYDGRDGVSLVQRDWKLILPLSRKFGGGPELYRWDADPNERENLAEKDPVRTGWLTAQLRLELLRASAGLKAAPTPIDDEARKALRALGYI
jgi:arylsulfatase A-like enzyme